MMIMMMMMMIMRIIINVLNFKCLMYNIVNELFECNELYVQHLFIRNIIMKYNKLLLLYKLMVGLIIVYKVSKLVR